MSSNQKPNNNHRVLPITAKQVADMVFVMEKLTLQQRRDLLESARQMNDNNRSARGNDEGGEVKYLGKKKYIKEFRKGKNNNQNSNNNQNNNRNDTRNNDRSNNNRNNNRNNRNDNQNDNRNNNNRNNNNRKIQQESPPDHSPPPSDDEDDGELPSADKIVEKPKIGGGLKFKKREPNPPEEPKLDLGL